MILLTGATGFIGQHLVRELVDHYNVANVVAFTRKPISGIQCLLHDHYEEDAFDFVGRGYAAINTIIHAGAYIPKSNNVNLDAELADQNIAVTTRLLDANLPNLQRIIFTSTIDVYASSDLLTEDTEVLPRTEYARSKIICEQLIEHHAHSRGLTSQILRVGHVYGPGEEKYEKIIPTIMRNIHNSNPIRLVGVGQSKRSFVYVKDVTRMILQSIHMNESVGPVNIGGCESISMKDLAELIISISGKSCPIEYLPGTESSHRTVDVRKMNNIFDHVQIPLRQGLYEEWKHMSNVYDEHTP
jgi:UDP-glucose 4-epimerase